ncbi:MAG: ABC transporter permease [Lachnospiraceae bacterium]|nr:ABC transporter permease [Lachnospiraceae bacterium]
MKMTDLLSMSLGSLFKRKVRTILTILGVIIGTTSIVVMISLGIGMKQSMLEDIENYGSLTQIIVRAGNMYGMYDSASSDGGKEGEEKFLDDALVEQLQMLEFVKSVDPVLNINVVVKSGIYENSYVSLCGMGPEALENVGIKIGEGELPKDPDKLEFFYGNMVLSEFQNSKTNEYPYYEKGELAPVDLMNGQLIVILDQDSYWAWQWNNTDESGQPPKMPKKYMIPTCGVAAGGPEDYNGYAFNAFCNIDALKTALKKEFKGRAIPGQPTRKNGKPYKEIFYTEIRVNVVDMDHVSGVQSIIRDMGYSADANAEWIEQEMKSMNIIQAVLGGIGAVSLLVAAIGIANTMMMSIYERTKEIGIMKVIGCRIKDIQALFLFEAGYIGLIGGVLGVGLSYLLSYVINKLLANSDMLGMESGNLSRIPPWLCLISIVFAVFIAMFSGFFPSIRAMKLSPLAAIRAE